MKTLLSEADKVIFSFNFHLMTKRRLAMLIVIDMLKKRSTRVPYMDSNLLRKRSIFEDLNGKIITLCETKLP